MRAGIFGWSYPPGCSGPPDEPEMPCGVCGMREDDCKCHECTAKVKDGDGVEHECGAVGCLEHMDIGVLLTGIEQYNYLASQRERELKRRSLAEAVTCEKCGAKIPRDYIDGMHWCDKCEAMVGYEKGEW